MADPATILATIWRHLSDWAQRQVPLVVMNARLDLSTLYEEFRRHGISQPHWRVLCVVDPLILDWHIDKMRNEPRTLVQLCQRYNVDLEQAHDAASDARAAIEVARAIARSHRPTAEQSPPYLTAAQRRWRRECFEWRAKRDGRTYDSDADLGWPVAAPPDPTPPKVKPRTGNSHQRWTPEECSALKDELAQGMEMSEIAKRHHRSIVAIHCRAQKLGLIPWDQPAPNT